MTQSIDTLPVLLVCQRCGQAAMGLWAEGERCPSRRCRGPLVTQVQPEFSKETDPAVHRNGHDPSAEALEASLPLKKIEPTDGGEETPAISIEIEGEEFLAAPPDGDLLAGRAYAVSVARQVLEQRRLGEAIDPAVLAEIHRRFVDLGAIYRPPTGVINIQRTRQQHRGQFFTNPAVGRLLFRLLDPPEGARVLESCLGIGNLIAKPERACVTGIDVDRDAITVARALMGDCHCLLVDEFQHHRFDAQFDLVLGNPPYSLRLRDRRRLWQHVGWDGWGRAESLWLEQAFLAAARPGLVAAVLPTNALESLEPALLRWVRGKGQLLARIDLPPDAHASSDWPTALFLWAVGTDYDGPTFQEAIASLDENAVVGLLARWPAEQLDLLVACRSAWQRAVEQRCLAGDDGPLTARAWTPPARQERRKQNDNLPLVDSDVVLLRIGDGRLRLVPNGWAAQAKLVLMEQEAGTRYDRKREVHISLWQELVEQPPLLSLQEVTERLRCYGMEVAIDGQSQRWLARQRRWYQRQIAPLSRWLAGAKHEKGENVDLDKAA